MLPRCGERVADEVAHGGIVGQGDECMPEPLRKIDRAEVTIVENYKVPLPERRRSDSDIDYEVHDCTANRRHVLRLTARDVREMDAAHYASFRDRRIGLSQVQRVPDGFAQLVEAVPLEKHATIITEELRSDFERAWNGEFSDLHVGSLATGLRVGWAWRSLFSSHTLKYMPEYLQSPPTFFNVRWIARPIETPSPLSTMTPEISHDPRTENMLDLDGKKVLISQGSLFTIAGSETVTFELAQHFSSRGADVIVVTYGFNVEWSTAFSDLAYTRLYRYDDPELAAELRDWIPDIAWIHHQLIPAELLRRPHETRFVFHHMSAMHPGEFPISYEVEAALASAVVFAAPETRDAQVGSTLLDGIASDKLSVLGNPAPDCFFFDRSPSSAGLRRLLVVSNHVPDELRVALAQLNGAVELRIRGNEKDLGAESASITPDDLRWADAVVTIGKTVQYALASATPVFCYDYFGGPGWLSSDNFESARYANFSGRGFARKSAELIVNELLEGLSAAQESAASLRAEHADSYRLSTVVDRLMETITRATAVQPDARDVEAQLLLQDQRRIFINVAAAREGDVGRLERDNRTLEQRVQEMSFELNAIKSSRSFALARRIASLRSISHH